MVGVHCAHLIVIIVSPQLNRVSSPTIQRLDLATSWKPSRGKQRLKKKMYSVCHVNSQCYSRGIYSILKDKRTGSRVLFGTSFLHIERHTRMFFLHLVNFFHILASRSLVGVASLYLLDEIVSHSYELCDYRGQYGQVLPTTVIPLSFL